jgi:hypothetical protein
MNSSTRSDELIYQKRAPAMDGHRLPSTTLEEPLLRDRLATRADLTRDREPQPIQKRWPMLSRRVGEASPLARDPNG